MRINIDANQLQGGYLAFPGEQVVGALSSHALADLDEVSKSFERLSRDEQMGDGGRYRFRRFSRFNVKIEHGDLVVEPLQGHSILQSKEDNPLNGGVLRTFEPLERKILEGRLLRELIRHDVELVRGIEPGLFDQSLVVGVHQVRIVALPQSLGKPTPEGVHRDAERYTFQHFWRRAQIQGGEFSAYDESKNQVFRWLQTELLDSVLFTGTTWHSASPIRVADGAERGFRDIFLIDFDRA